MEREASAERGPRQTFRSAEASRSIEMESALKRCDQSIRSARSGSIRAARADGIRHASAATIAKTTVTPP